MAPVNRSQKNNVKDGDVIVGGKLTLNSGIQFGGSGITFPVITAVKQVVDLAQVASGIATTVEVAFTSGAAGIIGSGDYCIPLTRHANTGVLLFPAQTTTGDSLAFGYTNMSNVDPAAAAVTFLIVRNIGI